MGVSGESGEWGMVNGEWGPSKEIVLSPTCRPKRSVGGRGDIFIAPGVNPGHGILDDPQSPEGVTHYIGAAVLPGFWERIYLCLFKPLDFEGFKKQAGLA